MPFFPRLLVYGVLALSAILFLVSLALIIYAVGRRIQHEQDFIRLDEFRQRLLALFAALGDGTVDYNEALSHVTGLLRPRFQLRMERILLEHLRVPADAVYVKRMAEDLGFVDRWRECLQSPNGTNKRAVRARFFTRARNAENLGLIRHDESWKLLSESLRDPNTDVQRVALRSLAAIGEPGSFPVLVEHLERTVGQPGTKLSERDLVAALARFPLLLSGGLLPLLRHSNPKIRLLAAQILVQMTAAQEAESGGVCLEEVERGIEISGLIFKRLATDGDADIRARAATLLASVRDNCAHETLWRLLNDEAWFVRLHAVRSLARRRDAGALTLLPARLTDAHWRVREAAAHALASCGAPGIHELVSVFLSTDDAFAREQIAEELETSGELARMLARCAAGGAGPEFEVLKEIVGKKDYFQTAMGTLGRASQRSAALTTLAESSHAEVKEWANHVTAR
ncbi:MAG: HEAT repeat domain-containing protein [Terriglobia bacterium]